MSLVDDYIARGGVIHKAPPAYAAPTLQSQGLSISHRQALHDHAEALERIRLAKLPRRKELRNATGERTPDFQVQREVNHPDRTDSHSEPEEKTPAKATTMTTVNRFQNASEEVTIYRHTNGTTDIRTIDYQGREFVSHFGRNNSFQGSRWVNADQFKHADLK